LLGRLEDDHQDSTEHHLMTDLPDDLEVFRPYLNVLARTQLASSLQRRLDASDIVQQTMLHAHQAQKTFRGASKRELASWLRQILAHNLAHALRDNLRDKRDLRRERSLEAELNASSVRLNDLLGDEQTAVEERTARDETLLHLALALDQMPTEQRKAIELHYLQELPISEVANQMEKSLTAVGGLLHRGLKQLRKLLASNISKNKLVP